jgi:LysR family glycine cleavage system transcriptional activator
MHLPPLNSLRCFEAAARHRNFTAAAKELGVTQAAVSKQIKNLEEHLGLPLFNRSNGRMQLTREAERLFHSTSVALTEIETTVAQLRRKRSGNDHLTIATTLAFANFWLMPRIALFRAQFQK